MSKRLYVGSAGSNPPGEIRTYLVDNGALTLEQTLTLSDSRRIVNGGAGIADALNNYLWYSIQLSSNAVHFARSLINPDGTLEDAETLFELQGVHESDISSRADAARILAVGNHVDGFGPVRLTKASDGTTLVKFDSPTATNDIRTCCYLSDTRAVISDVNGVIVLLSISDSAIAEVTRLTPASAISVRLANNRIDENRVWANVNGSATIYDFSGDIITKVAEASGTGSSGLITRLSPNRAAGSESAFTFAGSTVTADSEHDAPNGFGANSLFAGDDSGKWIAATGGTGVVNLWPSTGDPDTASDSVNTGTEIRFISFSNSLGPTTSEQIFQATYTYTYANAGAAPPKRTALVRPLDVQRSIDTDVSWLARNPKTWTVEAPIRLGEADFYRPGNVFWVQANLSGLREGRKVVFKGFAAKDIRPTELAAMVFTSPTSEEL